MFAARISQKRLAPLCRSLGTSLRAGVPILKALELTVGRTGNAHLRRVLDDIIRQVRSGEELSAAFASHDRYFPRLAIEMITVADQAGALPEVLLALSDHYENNVRLRKDFLGQIALPMIQFFAAIFVIAGLIWILGLIAGSGAPLDVLGFGLAGTSGALTWLSGWGIGIAGVFVAYKLAAATASGRAIVHRVLMGIPVVGGCMRAFAVARFSWAFHLTQEAAMPIGQSLESSLRATSNGAFIAAAPGIIDAVMEGSHLYEALDGRGLFPDEFIAIVQSAETSGTVPEELHRLSGQFEEQARRSLRALAATAGWAIWALVAAFIIFLIFRIALWYIGMLNEAANMATGV